MASQIQLTRSGTSGVKPAASELEYGELALNYADGKLYYKDDQNNLKDLNDTYQNSNNTIFVNSTNSAAPKIGLETTSPEYLLDLGGSASSSNSTIRINRGESGGTAIRIGGGSGGSTSADTTLLRVDDGDGSSVSASNGFSIDYLGSNGVGAGQIGLAVLADNQTGTPVTALMILQDGNVGIGQNTPAEALDVVGNIKVSGIARTDQLLLGDEWDTNSPAGGQKIYIKDADAASNYDPLGEDTDGNNNTTSNKGDFPLIISTDSDATLNPTSHGILLYNADGGAGTFAPSILFGSRESEAQGGGDPAHQYRTATAGIYCRSPLGVGGASSGHYGDGELIFATAGTLNGSTDNSQGLSQRMVIDRSGRVGIGTNTPLAPLHIDQKLAGSPALILQAADPQLYFLDDTNEPDSMRLIYNGATNGLKFQMVDNTTSTVGATVFQVDTTGDVTAGGTVTAATPTTDTHLTTKAYVDTVPGLRIQHKLFVDDTNVTITSKNYNDAISTVFANFTKTAGTEIKLTGRVVGRNDTSNWKGGIYYRVDVSLDNGATYKNLGDAGYDLCMDNGTGSIQSATFTIPFIKDFNDISDDVIAATQIKVRYMYKSYDDGTAYINYNHAISDGEFDPSWGFTNVYIEEYTV